MLSVEWENHTIWTSDINLSSCKYKPLPSSLALQKDDMETSEQEEWALHEKKERKHVMEEEKKNEGREMSINNFSNSKLDAGNVLHSGW